MGSSTQRRIIDGEYKLVYQIVVSNSKGDVATLSLGPKAVTVGRARDCDVPLEDLRVSRYHCVLSLAGGRPTVIDENSTNGILVNGSKVRQAWLRHGDQVSVGSHLIEVSALHPTPRNPPRPSSKQPRPRVMTPRDPLQTAERLSFVPPPETKSQKKQLGLIYRLGALLARAIDVDSAAEAVAELVAEAIPVDRVFIVLLDQEHSLENPKILAAKSNNGDSPEGAGPSRTVLEKTMESGLPLYYLDVQGDPTLSDSRSLLRMKTRVALCTPMRQGEEEVLGLLYADAAPGPAAPTKDALALFEGIADQAALAISRGQLHSELVNQHQLLLEQRDELDDLNQSLEKRVEQKTELIDQQRMELALRLDELERLQHAKESMARGLVHDMRNLVGVITANLRFLREQVDEGTEQAEVVDDVLEGSTRIISMAEDVLTVSRMEDGSFQLETTTVSLSRLVAAALRRFTGRARELEITIENLTDSGAHLGTVDVEVLDRVLDNLIGNALRYAGREGTVSLSVHTEGRLVDLVVADTGPGVTTSDRDKIFEEWYRSSGRSARHHGIGLYFCRLAAEAHGGSIRVEGEPGNNRFVVSLPATCDDFDGDVTIDIPEP